MAEGIYERHVAGLIAVYRRKRDILLAALAFSKRGSEAMDTPDAADEAPAAAVTASVD